MLPAMKPHAFVAMPFGTKPGADGKDIDFNAVFKTLLEPALEDAGFEVFRADEEQRAGDIRTDMFQELLAADLVLVDLTIDNPNVWYELGVRHALRERGVVLVQGPRATKPFDIYTDRKRTYGIAGGVPDPATLEHDRQAIADMARETREASTRRKVSPVFSLLPHLKAPEWQDLLLTGDNEFAQAQNAWASRIKIAQNKNRAGDILVLASETPVRALERHARFQAGKALIRISQFVFALEQFEAALAIDPEHLPSRQQRALCLGRLGRFEEAAEAVSQFVQDPACQRDAESIAFAGRIAKESWTQRWRPLPSEGAPPGPPAPPHAPGALKDAASSEDALLADAITPYRRGFVADPSHYDSGINALTLNVVRAHLGGEHSADETDRLLAGVRWSVASALERSADDYWCRATQAELSLLCFDKAAVQRDWKAAVAKSMGDWFALDSSRQTLVMLSQIGFRPEETALALSIVDAELARLASPFVPRQVLLFSGHMVDAPAREKPRFPQAKVGAAEAAIARALDALNAGAGDIGLTQGAAGGDILFTEQCQQRGVRMLWLQPMAEPDFIEASILRSREGPAWRDRFFAAKAKPGLQQRNMIIELGPLPKGVDLWERCNLWLLSTALAYGPDKARFVCLWDGAGGDGPGGTKHMYDEVKRRTGRVSWVDVRTL